MKGHGYRDPETLEDLGVMTAQYLELIEQNHEPPIKVVLRQRGVAGKIEHVPFAFSAKPLLRRPRRHQEARGYAKTASRKMRMP